MKRLCIYSQDVQIITGKSARQSRTMIKDVKLELNKTKKHLLTIKEFCTCTGLPQKDVEIALGISKS